MENLLFSVALAVKKHKRCGFDPWEDPWRKKWPPAPVFLPAESQGQRSLAGCRPWGRKASDTAEHSTYKLVSINLHLRNRLSQLPMMPNCSLFVILDFSLPRGEHRDGQAAFDPA